MGHKKRESRGEEKRVSISYIADISFFLRHTFLPHFVERITSRDLARKADRFASRMGLIITSTIAQWPRANERDASRSGGSRDLPTR